MLPGITERQGRYLADVAAALGGVAEYVRRAAGAQPRRRRARRARVRVRRRRRPARRDAHLRARPARRARARPRRGCRSASPTSSPSPQVTAAWDMADMTYNQGVHGAQDTANAMVRAGAPFDVITEDWQSDAFRDAVGRWARAAARGDRVAVAQGRACSATDERHGRHPGRRERAAARARPAGHCVAPGRPVPRGRRRSTADAGRRGDRATRTSASRSTRGCQHRGARGPRPHAGRARADPGRARLRRLLDPLRRDRRRRPLRAAAVRRRVQPDGQGLRLRGRGRRADRRPRRAPATCCSATRTSPRCTRWTSRPTRS